ncbi:Alpha/Beta hydrolase protein [Kockovaella imperatae]|uniref:Alpha/Beta hydrolase protein n=1 Tax=Kockovaella imperatae TaxID=4999 RepID=A0A1Y1UIT9_9TREE|nr:Alpha/Beta hydrolase protein [Kockovaella imperatae]ORX37902.1 Alpha/Beta hydrolase protein [Kockovaella imperatae]
MSSPKAQLSSKDLAKGFGTLSVAAATTPTVISTFFSHIFARRRRKKDSKKSIAAGGPGGGPENQLSYEEGLKVVRRFLEFASRHGVDEVQSFTAMPVPVPHWVRRKVVTIPEATLIKAGDILAEHLSSYGTDGRSGGGLKIVGGSRWWRIRGRELEGEWIEMQKDYLLRHAKQGTSSPASQSGGVHSAGSSVPPSPGTKSHDHHYHMPRRSATLGSVRDNAGGEVLGDRVILYIHGGAFFFSSLDTHRYQIQRHARKAGARAFAPSYRLAPQYPFPCGLMDALASYLYLLDPPPGTHGPILPSSIIFMGDSAGAGLVISLLIVIREMGLPMPAGASLVSPWVDLTHSMPSINGADEGDYIPSYGFHYRPGVAWPPLPGGGVKVTSADGEEINLDDQIQMYCPNNLLTHPLVSPVNAGSLGGLCPLLIVGGGGELLRDEITYLAYKASAPTTYQPSSRLLTQYPDQAAQVSKYPPTKVHLQIYEGCCHVVTTLSWTRSSKYMYRACANFNIWAYKAAAKAVERHLRHERSHSKLKHDAAPGKTHEEGLPRASIESSTSQTPSSTAPPSRVPSVLDMTRPLITPTSARLANADEIEAADLESEASTSDTSESDSAAGDTDDQSTPTGVVTVRGTEPLFGQGNNIVAERVSTHGNIRPFEAVEAIPALHPDLREQIGQIHADGAVQRWLAKRREWDEKYSSQLARWRKIKEEDNAAGLQNGFLTGDLQDENPPLCALVRWSDGTLARRAGRSVDEFGTKENKAIGMWTRISSKADEEHAGGENMEEIRQTVAEELHAEGLAQPLAHPIETTGSQH